MPEANGFPAADHIHPIELLGRGLYADVWRAHDSVLRREVAVKWIDSGDDITTTGVVLAHATALARVSSRFVVQAFGIYSIAKPDHEAGSPAIVMELVDGFSFAEAVVAWRDQREILIELGTGVVAGLEAIHAQGICHGDLHAGNIMVSHDGTPKIIDILYLHSLAAVGTKTGANLYQDDIREISVVLRGLLDALSVSVDQVDDFREWVRQDRPDLKSVRERFLHLCRGGHDASSEVVDVAPGVADPPVAAVPAPSGESVAPSFEGLLASARTDLQRLAVTPASERSDALRQSFFRSFFEAGDALRIRSEPTENRRPESILATCQALTGVRDLAVDWVLLSDHAGDFEDHVIELLELLLELGSATPGLVSYNERWFVAHRLFAHETLLYIVATLVSERDLKLVGRILTSHLVLPAARRQGQHKFGRVDELYEHCDELNAALQGTASRWLSPEGEMFRRHATRADLPFGEIVQADLVVLLVALLTPEIRWYPHTLHYASAAGGFPLFMKAARRRDFRRVQELTGVEDADQLRAAIQEGAARLDVARWPVYRLGGNVLAHLHAETWNTLG